MKDNEILRLEAIKNSYSYLNLSNDQALMVEIHENDKSIFSDKHYFSVWEEFDFDLTVFSRILGSEQLEIFRNQQNTSRKRYGEELSESDKVSNPELRYYQKLCSYLLKEFIPYFSEHGNGYRFGVSLKNASKIDYLKREYEGYLNNERKRLLSEHFRFCRGFKPNELENQLLKQKINYLLPNYKYFKNYMDGPTREIAIFIENTFYHVLNDEQEIIENKFEELKNFSVLSYRKYFGDESLDDTFIIKEIFQSPKEDWMSKRMSIFLMDKNYYNLVT